MGERKTLDDITSMLMEQTDDTPPAGETDDAEIAAVLDDEAVDDDAIQDDSEDTSEDDSDEAVDEADEEIPSEGNEDDEDDDTAHDKSDDEQDYLDITDEDLIEVKIDGEVVYRTVEDAKKALSGEGAIEKRLKEATQTRNEATQFYESGVRELEDRRVKILETVAALDQFIFKPLVPEPDDSLRLTNPQVYIQQVDAYKADQERIHMGRQQLKQGLTQQVQEHQQVMQTQKERIEQRLPDIIPALKDPENRAPVMNRIVSTAKEYGISENEIAQYFDERVYAMVNELAELKAAAGKRVDVKKVKEKAKTRAPRRLRSGVAQKMSKQRQNRKAAEKIKQRAASTGKVDDITRLIMTKPGRQRR